MTPVDEEPMERGPASAAAPEPAPTTRIGRRWIVLAVGVAVLAVGGVATAVIATRDDAPSYDTAQIGRMHDGCQRWADSYRGSDGPDGGWCTSMTDWMNGRMEQRRGGMMTGPMMWQDADSMRATCEGWMADRPAATTGGADRSDWCDQMVDWMSEHMGDWDHWMRDGPMSDGPMRGGS